MRLQVALDVLTIEEALDIAEKCDCSELILEVGTPLIKSQGMKAVSTLKERFPECMIAADMKTMDTGYLEVKIAVDAGADIVTVMGTAPIETIKEAVRAATELDVQIVVDMMNVKDKVERINEIGEADYFMVHTAIDEQKKGKVPFEEFKKVKEKNSVKLAIAGGINLENIDKVVELKPDLVIVGGAISKSNDVEQIVSQFLEKLE